MYSKGISNPTGYGYIDASMYTFRFFELSKCNNNTLGWSCSKTIGNDSWCVLFLVSWLHSTKTIHPFSIFCIYWYGIPYQPYLLSTLPDVDVHEFGESMLEAKSKTSHMSPKELVMLDSKVYKIHGRYSIPQIATWWWFLSNVNWAFHDLLLR